jgi:hypothetical protein
VEVRGREFTEHMFMYSRSAPLVPQENLAGVWPRLGEEASPRHSGANTGAWSAVLGEPTISELQSPARLTLCRPLERRRIVLN